MIRLSIRRPVAIAMAYLAVALLGVAAWRNIPIELLPDTRLPRLSVAAAWPGASPETMEAFVTSPLEAAIQQVRGVEKVRSVSREEQGAGRAEISVEFARGTDMNFARLELSERLGALETELPARVRPMVSPYVPREFEDQNRPFMTYTVTGPYTPEALRAHLDEVIAPEVRQVDGVGDVFARGGRARIIEIELAEDRIASLGLSTAHVRQKVAELEYVTEAGSVEAAGILRAVAIRDRPETVAEIRETPVLSDRGRVVRIGDVARVHYTLEDARDFYRIDGRPAVSFDIFRDVGVNAVALADAVQDRLDAIRGAHPSGLRLILDHDESEAIRTQLTDLRFRALVAAAVIFLVLLLFLRSFRSAAIVFATIAFSILITLNLIYFGGHTLNVLTLMGLAMGFGLIVDTAIVVLENIYRRHRRGDTAAVAAERGAREVVLPVLAGMLTTVVVFIPFVYLQGELRVYYIPLAVVVGFSLVASLFVAFSFIPGLAAKLLGQAGELAPEAGLEPAPGVEAEAGAEPAPGGEVESGAEPAPEPDAGPGRAPATIVRSPTDAGPAQGTVGPMPSAPGHAQGASRPVSATQGAASGAARPVKSAARWAGGALRRIALPLRLLARAFRWYLRRVRAHGATLPGALEAASASFGSRPPLYVRAYSGLVGLTLRHPWLTIAIALFALGGSYHLFDKYVTRGTVWTSWWAERTYIDVRIRFPRGGELERTDELTRHFEQRIAAMPEVDRFVTNVRPTSSDIRVTFPSELEWTAVPLAIQDQLVAYSHLFGGADVRVYGRGPSFYGGGASPPNYALQVKGYNYEAVRDIAEDLGSRLQRFSRIRDVDTNASGRWFDRDRATEFALEIDRRRLAHYDLTTRDVVQQVAAAVRGQVQPGYLRVGGEELPFEVKLDGHRDMDDLRLRDLLVPAPSGQPVRLGEVSQLYERDVLGRIVREDQQYHRTVAYEFRGPARLGDRVRDVVVDNTVLPHGYTIDRRQTWQWAEEERQQIYAVLAIALFLIFMATAALFESLRQPLVVLLAVPMALVGVFLIFFYTGANFTREAYIGVIMMGGIVVNNAILLVDHVNQLRRGGGLPLGMAVMRGTLERVRPILMTSATTIFGLLPLVLFAEHANANIWNALGYALIGGLASSTLFVLTVTPALYLLFERGAERRRLAATP